MAMDVNMISVLIFVLCGSLAGILAGLNPSVNISISILMFYPLLSSIDVYSLIAFYIGILITSQYMGSVIASTVGIPGEASSIPAVKEGYAMNIQGRLTEALRTSAISSAVGSVVAVIAIITTITYISYLHVFYALTLQLLLLGGCIVISVITSSNKFIVNCCLMGTGYLLGTAGITQIHNTTWFTEMFDVTNVYFMAGIPTTVAFIFLYALPTLFGNKFNDDGEMIVAKQDSGKFSITEFKWISAIRGSCIGFFAGFIPSLTFTISSQLAYSYEKWIKRKVYKKGDASCLSAAEAANNSASLSFLIPLLAFGIPISASEILVYDMAVNSGAQFGLEWFNNINITYALVMSFIIANVIGLVSAWPLATLINDFVYKHNNKIFWVALVMLGATIINMGMEEYQLWYYLLLSGFLLPVAWFIRKLDCIPLIFGFMLSIHFQEVLTHFLQIYL